MIPASDTCMLPILRLADDGEVHRISDVVDRIADEFQLSESERRQMLPSGKAPVIYSRVNWALVYLAKAGLLKRPKRGHYVITERGREVLRDSPSSLTPKYLERFEEFREFLNKRGDRDTPSSAGSDSADNPDETIEYAYKKMRDELAADLLDAVKACSPTFFETLVIDLRWDTADHVSMRARRWAARGTVASMASSRKISSDWMLYTSKRRGGKTS